MPEYPKICFDRILPAETLRPMRTIRVGDADRAIIVFRKMWPNGSTLHVRFLDGNPEQRAIAEEQSRWWTEHANISFVFDDAPDAQIRIAFDPADGAWSYLGTDALQFGPGEPTMNLGFLDGGTAAHEFGHALGLAHEHSSPFGGIEWDEARVINDLAGTPNFWSEEVTRHNVLRKYSVDQIRGTEFDPASIMLYFFPDSWVLNGPGTSRNEMLSELDKAFIAGERAYPRDGNVEYHELAVIDSAGFGAAIGQPGEEDLYKFTVEQAGRYTIETGGETDVVMKLFGPNDPLRLIGGDDDGGAGRNARLVTELAAGDYFVQVRHYNTAGGTGEYSIRVMR